MPRSKPLVRTFMILAHAAILSLPLFLSSATRADGLTLEQLRNDPELSPEKFARYFANFEYRFRAKVQPAALFLRRRSGDCDDYAILAAQVLREKGYTPRLIAVRMPGQTHVVCFIEEIGKYLDYNYRNVNPGLVASYPDIADVAVRVAKSFRSEWISASEFTFESGWNRLVKTVTNVQVEVADRNSTDSSAWQQFGSKN